VVRDVLTGTHFMNGDVAAAEGAIAAGCKFYAGYPITPSSELAEHMAMRLPQAGGIFVQMEDEIASIVAMIGASWAGAKVMTATSGPGFSLMMENYGLAIMTETPCVIVNVQRGGPSTGIPTLVGQGDVMQARWGSHGPYEAIAVSPNSPQECFDLTIRAFNLAERFRTPVVVLMDESVGHMFEKVVIPDKRKIKIVNRKLADKKMKGHYLPYLADDDLIPPMAIAGEGFHVHITGLTHDERGYPDMSAEAQERLIRRLINKIKVYEDEIIDLEFDEYKDDADIYVISYGISSRCSRRAVKLARDEGIKASLVRLKTVWPFPEKYIRNLAKKAKAFVVAEINNGQILREVERCAGAKPVYFSGLMGGRVHYPEEILEKIEEAAGK